MDLFDRFKHWIGAIVDRLNGDEAYRRYLRHWSRAHAADESVPMSRKEFFASETERRWSGIKRCC